MRWLGAILLAPLLAPGGAVAQGGFPGVPLDLGQPTSGPAVPSPILTVDMNRLFLKSAWGLRVVADLEEEEAKLAAETAQIEQDLIAEEKELTRLRPEMDPVAFRDRAEEFDAKVQRLRTETSERSAALSTELERERQRFLAGAVEVLKQAVEERGAVAIIDNASVLLSIGDIDITDEAIERADAALGDGSRR